MAVKGGAQRSGPQATRGPLPLSSMSHRSGPSALDCHATTWIEDAAFPLRRSARLFSGRAYAGFLLAGVVAFRGCGVWGGKPQAGSGRQSRRSFPFPWSDLGEPGFCFSDNLCRGGAEGAGPGLLGRNLAAGFPLHRLADGPRPKHPRLGRGAGKCRRRCSDRSPAPDAGGWTPPRDRPAPFYCVPLDVGRAAQAAPAAARGGGQPPPRGGAWGAEIPFAATTHCPRRPPRDRPEARPAAGWIGPARFSLAGRAGERRPPCIAGRGSRGRMPPEWPRSYARRSAGGDLRDWVYLWFFSSLWFLAANLPLGLARTRCLGSGESAVPWIRP